MRAFSIVTIAIFVAGYSTARWALATRLYELAIFAWDRGVVFRAAQGFAALSIVFILLLLPIVQIADQAADLVSRHDSYTWSLTNATSTLDSQSAAYRRAKN